jgi:glycosyltransferase involved in cell wall biosynthesis
LEPWYAIEIVLQAFVEVQAVFPEARLCILGSGSQEIEVRRLVKKLNLTGVAIPGRVPRESIGRFYHEADIFINASRVDNMPVSILEAFAAGLPVVTTDAGGIPYVVQHQQTGLVSETGNGRILAANVIRLLRDPLLVRRLVENAYRQSFDYHWDTVRQHWLCVYQALIPKSRSPVP